MALCAETTQTTELDNTTVLTKGNINGFKTYKPTGGHTPPIAKDGDKAPWKKAQKNGKNNIASESEKIIIPYFKPRCTYNVWCPSLDSTIKLDDQQPITHSIHTSINKRTKLILYVYPELEASKKNGSAI
jgi:hypothetical protein